MRTPPLPERPDPAAWLASCGLPALEPAPAPLAGADLAFTLALGFAAGAASVAALWLIDRWRNRPILQED